MIVRNQRVSEVPQNSYKERQIYQMRKQLQELQWVNDKRLKLVDEVKMTETQYSLLRDESERIDSEYKLKGEVAKINISELRNSINNDTAQINKYNEKIEDILKQIVNLSQLCEATEAEIAVQIERSQQLREKYQNKAESDKALNNKIYNMKEQRNKRNQQCQRLRKIMEDQKEVVKNLERQARQMQVGNQKHSDMMSIAIADKNQLLEELKSRLEAEENAKMKLEKLYLQDSELEEKIKQLEYEYPKSQQYLYQLNQQLENSIDQNKQLAHQIRSQQKNYHSNKEKLEKSSFLRQRSRNRSESVSSSGNKLNTQLDQVLLMIIKVEKQNEGLQNQLNYFIQQDEESRRQLNRKDSLNKKIQTMLNSLSKSNQEIAHLKKNNSKQYRF